MIIVPRVVGNFGIGVSTASEDNEYSLAITLLWDAENTGWQQLSGTAFAAHKNFPLTSLEFDSEFKAKKALDIVTDWMDSRRT